MRLSLAWDTWNGRAFGVRQTLIPEEPSKCFICTFVRLNRPFSGATELQSTDKIIDFVHVQMLASSFHHKVNGLHYMSALSLTRLPYGDRFNSYKLDFYVYTLTFKINWQLIWKTKLFSP